MEICGYLRRVRVLFFVTVLIIIHFHGCLGAHFKVKCFFLYQRLARLKVVDSISCDYGSQEWANSKGHDILFLVFVL